MRNLTMPATFTNSLKKVVYYDRGWGGGRGVLSEMSSKTLAAAVMLSTVGDALLAAVI